MNYNEQKKQLLGGSFHSIRFPKELDEWIKENAELMGIGYGTYVKIILNQVRHKGE